MKHNTQVSKGAERRKVISLFSGALGLDLGLEQAGLHVAVAVECNKFAAETIRQNRPDLPIIEKHIEDIPTADILEKAGLKVGEAFAVTGGPSCQAFSTAGKRHSMDDPRGVMFREFLRVVREAQPRFFVMENVRGVLSAAARHRPLNKRGPGYPALKRDEELGSAFALILNELRELKYHTVFDLVNAADYGTPQARERVLFIGSRDGEPLALPKSTHSREGEKGRKKWVTIRQALKGLNEEKPVFSELCASKKRYMELVPEGGNWRDLPKRLQKKALGAAYVSWGGRVGFFRRLTWDRPAPSLTTQPDSKATMLCHPTELRPLSVGEYTCLQQFPRTWKFAGGTPQKYKQVGNAVPVGLGKVVGQMLLKVARRRKHRKKAPLGSVVCLRKELLERLSKRPRTVLNPPRMRKRKAGKEAALKWTSPRRRGLKLLKTAGDALERDTKKTKAARLRPAARRSV